MALISYEWRSTRDNHAGMGYLAQKLQERYPGRIIRISIPFRFSTWNRIRKFVYLLRLTFSLVVKEKFESIFLMEFLSGKRHANHTLLAKLLRLLGYKGKIFGMVHLAPFKLLEIYGSSGKIVKLSRKVDTIVLMGNSLKEFLEKTGVNNEILFVPHYVDREFYKEEDGHINDSKLKVLVIGNTIRNYAKLKDIIYALPYVHFNICAGLAIHVYDPVSQLDNVTVYGYMEEDELIRIMHASDIGLSVMYDTIGSNAIVCSMAVGLPQVVSDVGSIRDYCDDSNAIFCNTTDDFIRAVNYLNTNREQISLMSKAAVKKSEVFDMQKIISWFKEQIIYA